MTYLQLTPEERRRAYNGIQCPECYGVRIEDGHGYRDGWRAFLCVECGCQWDAGMYRPSHKGE